MAWEIIYTKHAKKRMAERGIAEGDVEDAIHLGAKIHYERGIMCIRHGINVACVRKGNVWLVKTVYLESGD